MVRSFLVLENGTVLEGVSFGHVGTVLGEIVFTTSMAGYQESITDPASKGHIVVSAFPMVGCYGINERYDMSGAVQAAGLAVHEYCDEPSDMYSGKTLGEYLKENKVSGISGLDTRDVVKIIRKEGTMRAAIVFDEKEIDGVKKMLKGGHEQRNLVGLVSSKEKKMIDNKKGVTVGLIDCGVNRDVIMNLSLKYDIAVFPYDVSAEDILSAKVGGVVVSHGPGDPGHPDLVKTVDTIKKISSSLPVAGIGIGAQMIALAFGGKTVKLKFGHHGSSQPVKEGNRARITTQNHLYSADTASLDGTDLIADQFNVNDGGLEGFRHGKLPVFGIQYHPAPVEFENDSFFYAKLGEIMAVKK